MLLILARVGHQLRVRASRIPKRTLPLSQISLFLLASRLSLDHSHHSNRPTVSRLGEMDHYGGPLGRFLRCCTPKAP